MPREPQLESGAAFRAGGLSERFTFGPVTVEDVHEILHRLAVRLISAMGLRFCTEIAAFAGEFGRTSLLEKSIYLESVKK